MTNVTKRKTAAVELKALLGEDGDKLRRPLQEDSTPVAKSAA